MRASDNTGTSETQDRSEKQYTSDAQSPAYGPMQMFPAGSAGQNTLVEELPDHSGKRVGQILEDVSTTPDNMEKDFPVSEYWSQKLPVARNAIQPECWENSCFRVRIDFLDRFIYNFMSSRLNHMHIALLLSKMGSLIKIQKIYSRTLNSGKNWLRYSSFSVISRVK